MLTATLLALVGDDPVSGQPWRPLYFNLIRLVDKSVLEYEAARRALDQFAREHTSGNWSPLFRGVDHLENCVTALDRAILHLTALRSHPAGATLPRVARSSATKISRVRNAIEHTEREIVQGRVPENHFPFLQPEVDRVHVGGVAIRYTTLAESVTQIHAAAQALLTHR